jgi:hypothetical protein
MEKTITAFYQGIKVEVLIQDSYLNENKTPIARIKTFYQMPSAKKLPEFIPFDNLAFVNGEKCQAVKKLKKHLKKNKIREKKEKIIKKPAVIF